MYDKPYLKRLVSLPQYRPIADDGKLLPPSNPVYKDISQGMKEIGCEMSPKHIYTILNQNRNDFYNHVLDTFMPDFLAQKANTNIDTGIINYVMEPTSPPTTEKDIVHKEFTVMISVYKWNSIKPEEKSKVRQLKKDV